ncbi:general secretion pathway protein GspF [Marinobacter sp. SS8-8]|uniref:general secretion pathway protein GspF n=1 Tax=Marinobacter sp. SS8-8 TaxID=3050452 RepID=UPI0026E05318|nr:general secretion pathway protein GspF [Marinobacter sp. SS8-8]|tara:strand:+ start:32703 stop:34262 length:1560 start_codon:yes stop_codon:yes gene_type:complete
MFIRKSRKKPLANGSPLLHDDHGRPKTRREFIAQGLMAGSATVFGASLFRLFGNPRMASAALSPDLETLKASCGIAVQGAGKIPFICFDLAGGANIAGSNVLMGKSGGQMDFLSTAGYNKLGLPGDMLPNDPAFVNNELGLAFHSDSGFLRGILQSTSAGTRAATNGAIIAARSENDTGNNPHNPMYGIHRAGADGSLLSLVGSQSSESGGNSLAPMNLINPEVRPTKIDRPSDVTGLVDVGDLIGILDQSDAVAVMESIQRISDAKMNQINTGISTNDVVKDLVRCGYIKSADLADRFGNPAELDPELDLEIVGPTGIFSRDEFNNNREFRKTASVMKLVLNGYAGAGTITMGGYDYHTGERGTGERRDEQAGRCMGACLEYAARVGMPLMLYVFSDGSVSSNGRIDDSMDGRGKGEWTGDNQQTAASFFMVYNPAGRPMAIRNQIGFMRSDASVETASSPAANNVNQLVQTVLLNYMALHGEQADFGTRFTGHGLGNSTMQDSLIAFSNVVNGMIGN